jgi:hypothetical protein
MKPKILDPWAMSRIQMPERGYEKFFFCKIQFLIFRGQDSLELSEN